MPTWTTPRTWANNELVTDTMMNQQVRDNLNYLYERPRDSIVLNESANFSTTLTSFVNVDQSVSDVFKLELTTSGGDILVGFGAAVENSGGVRVYFDVTLDGVRVGTDDGIVFTSAGGSSTGWLGFTYLITNVSAASHTLSLQWKVSGSTGTMYVGAGTSGKDNHPQFWAIEV